MMRYDDHPSGRHFLQIPGPTNVPDRVLRAIDRPTIDHRGPEFARLGLSLLERIKPVFGTKQDPVVIYAGSGTGAWEAAMVNTLSPGDRILMAETGHFCDALAAPRRATRRSCPSSCPATGAVVPTWRDRARLAEDRAREIKAVCVVHNETSTGAVTDVPAVRRAIDAAGHPALLIVDTVSVARVDRLPSRRMGRRRDDRRVAEGADAAARPVVQCGKRQGARCVDQAAKLPRAYWGWDEIIDANRTGLLADDAGDEPALRPRRCARPVAEEGMPAVFARHARHGDATRAAVAAWGLENQCANPADFSNSLTAVRLPEGHDADAFRKIVLQRFDLSLGADCRSSPGACSASAIWATSTT